VPPGLTTTDLVLGLLHTPHPVPLLAHFAANRPACLPEIVAALVTCDQRAAL